MAKLWNYILISFGTVLLLTFAGIRTAATAVFDLISLGFSRDAGGTITEISSVGFGNAPLWLQLFGTAGIFTLITGGAIVVSFFTKAKIENLILVPAIISLSVFIGTFVSIIWAAINTGQVWISFLVLLIMGTYTIGFMVALMEFLRGTD